MELHIERVSKRYSGDKWAPREFSLKLGPGILGLLGPNGRNFIQTHEKAGTFVPAFFFPPRRRSFYGAEV